MSRYMPGALETATNLYSGNPYQLALGLGLPDPDAHSCTNLYGHPPLAACQTALQNIPWGELPSIFTTRPREAGNNYVTVPQRFVDSDRPTCAISIDLDGTSTKHSFVNIPWNKVRNISNSIIARCVSGPGIGGWETFGLKQAFDAVISPPFVDVDQNESGATTSAVVNPDGTIESVGIPEGVTRDPPSKDIPLYMVITVSSPHSRPSRDKTDFSISLNLREYLRQKFESTKHSDIHNAIARASLALSHRFVGSLMTFHHPRWWQFALGPATPEPTNIDYRCNAKLGSPGTGSCEAVLYEMVRGGKVLLDPSKGPVIKNSGDCAIGITSKVRQVVSWDMLRSVAEMLVVTCVASPVAAAAGGTAIPMRVRGQRKRWVGWKRATTTVVPQIEMSVYRQPPFAGAANQTCPWKVASSHVGDVRQCPAAAGPFRPPERNLFANTTVIRDGNITERVNATAAEFTRGNLTEVEVGNFTGSL